MSSNINNMHISSGSANVQIQQGVRNSSQRQQQYNRNEFDFKAYEEAIRQISQYEETFDSVFGDKADEARRALADAGEAVRDEKDPKKAKMALRFLKSLAENVAANLVAAGIVQLISQLPR